MRHASHCFDVTEMILNKIEVATVFYLTQHLTNLNYNKVNLLVFCCPVAAQVGI
jgi:hypothetical protein